MPARGGLCQRGGKVPSPVPTASRPATVPAPAELGGGAQRERGQLGNIHSHPVRVPGGPWESLSGCPESAQEERLFLLLRRLRRPGRPRVSGRALLLVQDFLLVLLEHTPGSHTGTLSEEEAVTQRNIFSVNTAPAPHTDADRRHVRDTHPHTHAHTEVPPTER